MNHSRQTEHVYSHVARLARRGGWTRIALFAALLFAASTWARGAAAGDYDLVSKYTGEIDSTRGWEVTWVIPPIGDPTQQGAIGEWYYNLESGLYHTGDGWFVYWFGDDNGLDITDPTHCFQVWDSGGFCRGLNGTLQPGQSVTFKYQWCTPSNAPSVGGSLVCLWADFKDGRGFQFLASDTRTTVEMYTHDMETFDPGTELQISCATPTVMAGQSLETASGAWQNMTGAGTWADYVDQDNLYEYQNFHVSSAPATWQSCSNPAPVLAPCSPARLTQDWYSGNMNTTDEVCLKTADNIAGWECSNFDGRTVQVNGVPVTCGGPLPPKWADGYYYFDVSAGLYTYADFSWWD